MNERGLLQLKERINKAKASLSESEGQKKYLMQELKEKFKCKSTQEAIDKHCQIEKEITELGKELAKDINEIEEEYNV